MVGVEGRGAGAPSVVIKGATPVPRAWWLYL